MPSNLTIYNPQTDKHVKLPEHALLALARLFFTYNQKPFDINIIPENSFNRLLQHGLIADILGAREHTGTAYVTRRGIDYAMRYLTL